MRRIGVVPVERIYNCSDLCTQIRTMLSTGRSASSDCYLWSYSASAEMSELIGRLCAQNLEYVGNSGIRTLFDRWSAKTRWESGVRSGLVASRARGGKSASGIGGQNKLVR